MSALLLFKYDFRTDLDVQTVRQLAERPGVFDLVAYQPDGFAWGRQELINPWFRVMAWPAIPASVCDSLLLPELPTFSLQHAELTILQKRQSYLNLMDAGLLAWLPAGFSLWWQDDKRAAPVFSVSPPVPPGVLRGAVVVRPPIAAADASKPAR